MAPACKPSQPSCGSLIFSFSTSSWPWSLLVWSPIHNPSKYKRRFHVLWLHTHRHTHPRSAGSADTQSSKLERNRPWFHSIRLCAARVATVWMIGTNIAVFFAPQTSLRLRAVPKQADGHRMGAAKQYSESYHASWLHRSAQSMDS